MPKSRHHFNLDDQEAFFYRGPMFIHGEPQCITKRLANPQHSASDSSAFPNVCTWWALAAPHGLTW